MSYDFFGGVIDMDYVNLAITGLFDVMLYVFRHIHPMWGLAAVSALTGVALAWVFAKASNQRKTREIKDRMKAHLLEMWIFRDNMRVVVKAQGQVAWAAARYAACSMRGLAVILVPVVLIMIQLQARYGYEPLKTGESRIVTIRLKEATPLDRMNVELEPSGGLVVETPALRIPEMREVSFRVKAVEPGEHEIGVVIAGERVQKTVSAGPPGCAPVRRRSVRLLLDTHIAIWSLTDPTFLSPVVRDLLSDPVLEPAANGRTLDPTVASHSPAPRYGRSPEADPNRTLPKSFRQENRAV